MQVRDLFNHPLSEGDQVALCIGSELGVGQIVKIDSGLGNLESNVPTRGSMIIQIHVGREILSPQGIAMGVVKIAAQPEKSSLVS